MKTQEAVKNARAWAVWSGLYEEHKGAKHYESRMQQADGRMNEHVVEHFHMRANVAVNARMEARQFFSSQEK